MWKQLKVRHEAPAVDADRDGTGLTSGRIGMIRLPELARVTRARGSIKSIKNVEYMI